MGAPIASNERWLVVAEGGLQSREAPSLPAPGRLEILRVGVSDVLGAAKVEGARESIRIEIIEVIGASR